MLRADVTALRDRVHAIVDDTISEASSDVTIYRKDGRRLRHFVELSIGSGERTMGDADLGNKFRGLVDPVLGNARSEQLMAVCAGLANATDLRAITAMCQP